MYEYVRNMQDYPVHYPMEMYRHHGHGPDGINPLTAGLIGVGLGFLGGGLLGGGPGYGPGFNPYYPGYGPPGYNPGYPYYPYPNTFGYGPGYGPYY